MLSKHHQKSSVWVRFFLGSTVILLRLCTNPYVLMKLAGFTPLILAATAGHQEVVEILLDHGADIEAQSERTKDTPLSLACSGGRFEVR